MGTRLFLGQIAHAYTSPLSNTSETHTHTVDSIASNSSSSFQKKNNNKIKWLALHTNE